MIFIMLNEILNGLARRSTQAIYKKDAIIFSRGDPVGSLFILIEGQVALSRFSMDGNELVLCRAEGPCVLAEASIYSDNYHCDAVALTACEIQKASKNDFISLLASNSDLAYSWSSHLAKMLQSARQQCEIMRLKKVSERVDVWLALNDGNLPPNGHWKGLAAQLGVSAEALYRELASRSL